MQKLLVRTLLGLVALLGLTLLPATAMADTGPWQWSDMSDKLSARDGRPVWSIARAEPYWYMTDGQDLASGGHVWKTDGSIVTDITTDVRNAGLSRVDDMVSDGQSVIFLKNVVRTDRSFEALALKNGSYSYPAYLWQQQMNQDEGLSSVTGKDGNWMIITNRGRVFNWNQINNTINSISLPGNPYTYSYYSNVYSIRHVSPVDGHSGFAITKAVPTSNGWIFMVPQNSGTFLRFYNYTNGYFSELTQISGITNLQMIASNGTQVLLVGGDSVNVTNRIYTVDGSVVRAIKTSYDGVSVPSITWNKTVAAHNGKSWLILSGKDLVRFDGTSFQTYGQTQDYFVQAIGNGNGTYLLGGAVSDSSNSGPTGPLTAKLMRVDEGTGYYGYVTPAVNTSYVAPSTEKVGTVNGMKNRITYWGWFNPNLKYHASDSTPKYTIGAQSNDGIKKIELYINDVWQKTCTPGNTKKNTECSMDINSADWPVGSKVGAFAKITSGTGRVAYVPALIVEFYDTNVKAYMSVDNNTPYLVRGNTNNFTVTGYAGTGLNRVELYVNGGLKKTCYTDSCTLGLNGYDYTVGSTVSFNGRAIANNGQEAWSWLGAYTVTDYGYNPTPSPSGDLSTWVWADPSGDFSTSDYKTIKAQANAANGLQSIEIIVNGTIKKACNFSRVYGTQNCEASIYGSSYPNSSSIPVYVRATDYYGKQATSQTLYLNTYYNNNSNLSVWFDNTGSANIRRDEYKTVRATARSGNGLRQIDLYANDDLIGTCTYSDETYSDRYCERSFYAGNYSVGTNVTLKAKATDRYGYTVWSTVNPRYYITDTTNYDNNTTVNISTNDNRTSYGLNETFNLIANAYDNDGIQKIELYANDTLINSWTFNNQTSASFSTNLVASNHTTAGNSLSLKARVTDRNGYTAWSSTKYVQITSGTVYNDNYTTTISQTLSPNQTNFNRNQTVTVNSNVTDANGIQRIRILVNGSVVNYCNPGYQTTANCSATFNTANYSSVSSLAIQTEVTDNNGNIVTSNTVYITLTNDSNPVGGTTQNNVPGTLSISSDADSGYTSSQNVTFTANGADENGIQKIELYVNADLVKTCDGASSCSYTGGPYNTASVTYGAKLIDSLGNATWNGYKVIYKK